MGELCYFTGVGVALLGYVWILVGAFAKSADWSSRIGFLSILLIPPIAYLVLGINGYLVFRAFEPLLVFLIVLTPIAFIVGALRWDKFSLELPTLMLGGGTLLQIAGLGLLVWHRSMTALPQ